LEKARRESAKIRRQLEMQDDKNRQKQAPSSFKAGDAKRDAPLPPTAKAVRKPPLRYNLPEGKRTAYSFVLETRTGDRRVFVAGVAAFDFGGNKGHEFQVTAQDNLQFVSSPPNAWSLPSGTRLLKSTFNVSTGGIGPQIEDVLPNLMGHPSEWFFPPLPHDADKPRSEGYTVDRGTMLNPIPAWDKRNRGHFDWEVKVAGQSGTQVKLNDSRTFRSDDRSQELVGNGEFTIDQGTGLLAARTFRGTYVLFDRKTEILLRIDRLLGEQLSKRVD
jgi:hypothetical protein